MKGSGGWGDPFSEQEEVNGWGLSPHFYCRVRPAAPSRRTVAFPQQGYPGQSRLRRPELETLGGSRVKDEMSDLVLSLLMTVT